MSLDVGIDRTDLRAGSFTVLAVCTGNICRSPAVERLLVARLGAAPRLAGEAGPGVRIESAGTRAVVGDPMPAEMASLVAAAGASPEAFAARQLTTQMVRGSDLVLALTRAHRSSIVALHPPAVHHTFTLRELARLLDGVDPGALDAGTPAERFAALLPLATARRGMRSAPAVDDDVVDPYGGTAALYRRAFDALVPAVEVIARVVRG